MKDNSSVTFEIVGVGIEYELGKIVSVDTDKKMIVLEEMANGKWRLTYTKSLIPDTTKFSGVVLNRNFND